MFSYRVPWSFDWPEERGGHPQTAGELQDSKLKTQARYKGEDFLRGYYGLKQLFHTVLVIIYNKSKI